MKPAAPFLKCALVLCALSLPGTLSANPIPTTTVLSTLAPTAPMNVPVALTAAVVPDSATGSVTFFDGATIVGTAQLTLGVAVLSLDPFYAGERALRAYYQGAGIYGPSYSAITYLTVQPVVSGSFGNIQFSPYATATISPVIGDFNNDGAPDTAFLAADGSVSLLLYQGNGNYGFSTPITGLNNPQNMVTGDFNADGKLDLAVADSFNSQVVVYIGNGDGTFQPGVSYATGNLCFGIAAGDFNGDGIVDLATENGANGLSLFINNGDGTFQAALNSSGSGNLLGFAEGDFNGDGIADLALANNGAGTIDIVFGSPSGFSAPVSYSVSNPTAVTVADFNGDHVMDLAVASNATIPASLVVLLGNENGTFQAASSVGSVNSPLSAIAAGDVDGDGLMDFVTVGASSFCASLGKGDGTFYVPYCEEGGYGNGLAVGAIDPYGRTGMDVTFDNQIALVHGGYNLPSVLAGNLQNVSAGVSAPTALEVQLTDYGHPYPLAGVSVTFEAPTVGPAGYFLGLGNAAAVTTLSDGTATAPEFVSNSALGDYTITAEANSGTADFSLVNVAPMQGGQACTVTVSPGTVVFDSNGGTSGTLSAVPSPFNCAFSASSNANWVSVPNTDFGGASNIVVTVPANLFGATRYATVLVAGQYVNVVQWGTAPVVSDAGVSGFPTAVTDMIGYGFSSGCSATPLDYCPQDAITRAQAAVLLVRAVYGSDNFSYSTTPHFNDVDASSFGFQWVQKLFELGITTGCGDGNFCPDETLPRDQAAVMLVRARLGANTPFTSPPSPYFADVPSSYWAFPYIQRLRLEYITSGCSPGNFCPAQAISRADLAAFIMRGLTNQFLPVTALVSQVTSAGENVRSLNPYDTNTLILAGQDTHWDQTSSVLVAGGISTNNFTVYSPTYATVDVSGNGDTLLDIPESIIVTTGAEQAVIPNPIVFENYCN